MTDQDRHRRASEIFLQACELPPDEQGAFIARECGDDSALRTEVESLVEHDRLAAEAGATRQLEDVVGEAAGDVAGKQRTPRGARAGPGPTPHALDPSGSGSPGDLPAGQAAGLPGRIGRYRIVRLIARGGMGEVYEAEQSTPVRRRVALKVIRAGLDSAEVLARFMAERQALALMSHPHIAAIHDAGATREGRPYVVMEYVDGEPVTEYAERHRLDLGSRLDLFLKICEAVSHAHQKGIIHRDLKPSNILVSRSDGRAVPKVIDFGIAKATQQPLTERTLETSLGQLVGTPEYMSPEQAAGTGLDVDTRADVYALGAVLYEILAGTNPLPREALKRAGLEEMLRLIREHEPARPSLRVSTLSRRLRQGRAGATEPAQPEGSRASDDERDALCPRPEGDTLARKLAGDLDWITMRALEKDRERRYGSVAAFAEDIRRYRRHQPVSAGPPSRMYRLRKFVQRNRAGVAFSILLGTVLVVSVLAVTWQWRTAVAERERAEAAGEHARQEAARAERINAFLQDMLASADPGEMGKDVTVREVLDQAAASLERGLAAAPRAEADAHHTLGETYVSLSLFEEGRDHLERALELRRELDSEDRESLVEELQALGACLYKLNQMREARLLTLEALRMQRRVSGEPHGRVGELLSQLSLIESRLADYDAAERLARAAVAQQEALMPDSEEELGESLVTLAEVYWMRMEWSRAEEPARRALAINESLRGELHPTTLENINLLALALKNQGPSHNDEAESLLRTALERARRWLGDDHAKVAAYRNNLATFLMEQRSRFVEAREHQLEALRIWRGLYPEGHTYIGTAMNNLGYIELHLGNLEEAEEWFQEVLELGRVLTAIQISNTALGNLFMVRHHRGEHEQALGLQDIHREGLAERSSRESNPFLWMWSDANRACLFIHMGRLEEAEELLSESIETLVKLEGQGQSRPGARRHFHHKLGLLRALQGRWDEAEPLIEGALQEFLEQDLGQFQMRHAYRMGEQICSSLGRDGLAEEHARALEKLERELKERLSTSSGSED